MLLSENIHHLVIFQIERLISNWEHQKSQFASGFWISALGCYSPSLQQKAVSCVFEEDEHGEEG